MITVHITKDEIKVTGHTLPDICASVSSAMYITANNLIDMQLLGIDKGECSIVDKPDADYMLIKVVKHSVITDVLLNTLKKGLRDIADDSDGNVKIKESH